MKRTFILTLLALLMLSACSSSGRIEAHEPWVRAAMKGENSAVYMVLHNHSNRDDELVGASSNVAKSVELHMTQMGPNEQMQMMHQTSIPLPAGAEKVFKPGGLHVMLIGLTRDLKVGDEIQVTLHFKNSDALTIKAKVKEEGNKHDMGGHQH